MEHEIHATAERPETDLTSRYEIVKELSAGANDRGYLVSDGASLYVALVPNPYSGDWNLTLAKVKKAAILDEQGLSDFTVHVVDTGELEINGKTQQAVIMEYGGETILRAEQDTERLEIAKQVLHVMETLHAAGYAINDFQTGHWLYQSDESGSPHVKMIDYQQILKVKEEAIRDDKNDHRKNDVLAFRNLLEELFPWATLEPSQNGKHSDVLEQVKSDLRKIEAESESLVEWQKKARAMLRRFRQRLDRLF